MNIYLLRSCSVKVRQASASVMGVSRQLTNHVCFSIRHDSEAIAILVFFCFEVARTLSIQKKRKSNYVF